MILVMVLVRKCVGNLYKLSLIHILKCIAYSICCNICLGYHIYCSGN